MLTQRVFLVFFVIMAAFACVGCNRSFKNRTALCNHKRACKFKISQAAKSILSRRKEGRTAHQANQALQKEQAKYMELANETISDDVVTIDVADVVPAEPLSPEYRVSGLPNRRRRLPKRFRDDLPPIQSTAAIAVAAAKSPRPVEEDHDIVLDMETDNGSPQPPSESHITTEPDHYGVYCTYFGPNLPTYDPDGIADINHLSDAPTFPLPQDQQHRVASWWSGFGSSLRSVQTDYFAPFLNATVFRLISWFYNGTNVKSLADLDRLVHDVILAPDFDRAGLEGFRAVKEVERIDEHQGDPNDLESAFLAAAGWKETTVQIRLPADGILHASEDEAPLFNIPGLFYRKPLEVLWSALCETSAEQFHLSPFHTYATDIDSHELPTQRIYSEIYNSDAMVEEHHRVREQSRATGCTLETVVAAIMFWSDSTHLANFGTASLWPIYMYLGNQSKYIRGRTTSFAAHHLAYIPKLPDTLQDFYYQVFNKAATSEILTLCRHEIMQAIWLLLLDDDFMHAYQFGLVVEFADGILRRVFPRIFTYSADYPEKVLLACLKFLGGCPCPRCLIKKDEISMLGTKADRNLRSKRARVDNNRFWFVVKKVWEWLFVKGLNIASAAVKRLLMPESLVPTVNAFSTRLSQFGVNFFSMFVPDLLHEFELGVWKATFTHLLRVLYAHGENAIQDLNKRYRQIPPFGRGTIRKFSNNVSGMKRLAA